MSSKKCETSGSRKMREEAERGESPKPKQFKRGESSKPQKAMRGESPKPKRFKRGESSVSKKSKRGESPKPQKSKRGESPKPQKSKREVGYPDLIRGGSFPSSTFPFPAHFTIPKLSGTGKVKIDQVSPLGRFSPEEGPIKFQTCKMESSSADGYGLTGTTLHELLKGNCFPNVAASEDGIIQLHYMAVDARGTSLKDLSISAPSDSGLGSNTSSSTSLHNDGGTRPTPDLGRGRGQAGPSAPLVEATINYGDDTAYESDDQDILIIGLSEEEQLEILNGFPPTRPPYDY